MGLTQGLTKTILYVQDMNQQIDFYCNKLELAVKSPAGLKNYSDQVWVELGTGECTLVLHYNGEKKFGEDRTKLAFSVHDIETAYKTLTERGVELSVIRSPSPDLKVASGFDPEGNPFAIHQ
ncbi:VOC family protein [Nostoc sp.]|uniref:VOC family protein n=1 Tax=Nostoc sp. TaxID=1180 RepID=UPI002FF9DD47